MNRNGVYQVVTEAAERVGLRDPSSEKMEDHFSPHCYDHIDKKELKESYLAHIPQLGI